ncbi:hypothetical protein DB44_DP00060 [Candidatus Protochlamydia amoebophila]|uniref:Transposase DDE domain-containing protein n=1 Tax=Candidatus Protochlamydia amoebophila TaxID=362787 RepID=A0A0C1JW29_9BACT|nr:hypothetical protein DB44_DP00060 [Candidatus Protochlamydia amoebophila]
MTEIAFINSIGIDVCHHKRMKRNKVFKSLAKKEKTILGWFFGFKWHFMINQKGEILAFQLNSGSVDDVSVTETLSKRIFGKLFGDKGNISTEFAKRFLEARS